MTSSPFFFNLLKENLKRRSWSTALSCLFFFFMLPVNLFLSASAELSAYNSTLPGELAGESLELRTAKALLHSRFLESTGPDSVGFLFFLALLAGIVTISGLAYLQDSRKTDLLHALPVSRGQLFLAVSLNSFLIAAVPCLLFSLLSGIALQGFTGYADSVPAMLISAVLKLCFYLLFQAVFTLAVMMTGTLLVSVLASCVFFFWGPMVVGLNESLHQTFFRTYVSQEAAMNRAMQFASPFCLSLKITLDAPVRALAALLIAAVVFGISLSLYRLRPSEAAGKAMAFPKTEAPIKVLVTVPVAIFFAYFFREIETSDGWMLFGLITGLLLCGCLMQIIYRFDFRRLFDGKRSLGLAALLSLGILAFFRLDLSGYDRYLPKEESVSGAGVTSGVLESNPTSYWYTLEQMDPQNPWVRVDQQLEQPALAEAMSLKDLEAVRELASQGIQELAEWNPRSRFSGRSSGSVPYESGITRTGVLVCWKLKNGRTVLRQYTVSFPKAEKSLLRIWDDAGFREAVYPLLSKKASEICGVNYQDAVRLDHVPGTHGETGKTAREQLFETYVKEFRALSGETRLKENPIGCLQFKTVEFQAAADAMRASGQGVGMLNGLDFYPVYPSFRETLKLLSDRGVVLNEALLPENLASVVARDTRTRSWYQERSLTAPESRKEPLVLETPADKEQALSALIFQNLNCQNPLRQPFSGIDVRFTAKPGLDPALTGVSGAWDPDAWDSEDWDSDYPAATAEPDSTYNTGLAGVSAVFAADAVPEAVREHFDMTPEMVRQDTAWYNW